MNIEERVKRMEMALAGANLLTLENDEPKPKVQTGGERVAGTALHMGNVRGEIVVGGCDGTVALRGVSDDFDYLTHLRAWLAALLDATDKAAQERMRERCAERLKKEDDTKLNRWDAVDAIRAIPIE